MAESNRGTMAGLGYVESFSGQGMEDPSPDAGGRRYFGKYRGTVVQNIDPERRGRLMVQVPEVLGLFLSSWAMPCVPAAGIQGGMFIVPPMQAGVWVEFEGGNPDFPIWTGFWWGSTPEVPSTAVTQTAPGVPVIMIQSQLQNVLVISDVPVPPMKGPGIMLRSGPSSLTIDPTGVTIMAPLITIVGATNINNGALTVLV